MALQHQPCQGVLRTSAIVAHDEQRENVLIRIERLLMDGVFSNGLGFEKLNTDGSMGTLFSIRLNNKARLLVTKVWLVHGWYWVLLDVLEKHEYDRSKLLASGGLTHFFQSHRLKLEQDIRDNGHEIVLPQKDEARAEGAEWVDFEFFNHQLIVLNEQQGGAAQTNLPIIVNGIPGSGKTCVAMSLLMQCLDANSERIMYVTSSNDLVSSMCATWRQAPSYDAADEAKLSLKSYKTLINELFPETRRLQQTGEQSFFNWFAKYRKQYKDLMSHQRDVYQEMRIISGLDIDEMKWTRPIYQTASVFCAIIN